MKVCRDCGRGLPLERFYRDRAARDGHRPRCRACDVVYRRAQRAQYYKRHREQLLADAGTRRAVRREQISQYNREYQALRRLTPRGRYDEYLNGAHRRGLEFSLTPEDFEGFWQQPCVYCGTDIPTIGLDRVDNRVGYCPGNVVPCCDRCNRMKRDLTREDFLAHILRVAARIK